MKDRLLAAFYTLLWVGVLLVFLGLVVGKGLDKLKTNAVKTAAVEQTVAVQAALVKTNETVLPAHAEAQVRIQTITKEIIREVPVYVPAGSCALPPGWRLLHDAAAVGEVPDPAGIPDAAPVDPEAAASAVAENYGACHQNAEQLRALQRWIEGVSQ